MRFIFCCSCFIKCLRHKLSAIRSPREASAGMKEPPSRKRTEIQAVAGEEAGEGREEVATLVVVAGAKSHNF